MLAQKIDLLFEIREFLAGLFHIATPPPLYDKGVDQRPQGKDEYQPAKIFHM